MAGMIADDPRLSNFAIGVYSCVTSTFASSVISEATGEISTYFGVSFEVGSLLSALYLCGYGVGPVIWAPISELRGRKLPLIIGNFGFAIFAVAVAVSKDIQTLMICRFFMGVFASSPLVVVAAMFVDIFRAESRGIALTCFCGSVFMGPMFGTCAVHLHWPLRLTFETRSHRWLFHCHFLSRMALGQLLVDGHGLRGYLLCGVLLEGELPSNHSRFEGRSTQTSH